MFTVNFDSYICPGDSITCEVAGFTITARIESDSDYGIDDDDCHNIDQKVTGCSDEQQKTLLANRQAWFDDEWWYGGIVLKVEKNGITFGDYLYSVWGFEINYPGSDNKFLLDAANEMLPTSLENWVKNPENIT